MVEVPGTYIARDVHTLTEGGAPSSKSHGSSSSRRTEAEDPVVAENVIVVASWAGEAPFCLPETGPMKRKETRAKIGARGKEG